MPVTRLFWFLEEQRLLTVDDLALLLGTTRRGIYNRRYRGELPPPIKTGALLRWDPRDVQRWLDERREAAK